MGQGCVPAGEGPDRLAAKPVPQHRFRTVLYRSIMQGSGMLRKQPCPVHFWLFLLVSCLSVAELGMPACVGSPARNKRYSRHVDFFKVLEVIQPFESSR